MKQKSSLKDRLVGSRYFSFGITLSLFVLLYVVGMMNYRGFMKPQVFCNLLIDNAALIIATIGITFVLLIGGIDISIGSVVALTCMSSAQMLQNTGLPAPAVILIVLAMGAVFGLVQGWLITEFNMQPFIVTLAGQFFARGMTAIISRETIVIDNPVYASLASARIYVLPGGFISVGVVIALVAAQFMQVAISAYMNAACASFFLTVASEDGMNRARRQMRDRLRQMGMDDSDINRAGFGEKSADEDDMPGGGEGDGT